MLKMQIQAVHSTIVRVAVSCVFIGLLVMSVTSFASSTVGSRQIRGTYSSLEFNSEGGDLLGYEVKFVPTNGGTKAVIQVAEGDAGRLHVVDIRQDGEKIWFDVEYGSGVVGKFVGRVTDSAVSGYIETQEGGRENVILERKASYWDQVGQD